VKARGPSWTTPELAEIIVPRFMVSPGLSYDHRIVDGATRPLPTTVKERWRAAFRA